MSNEKGFYINDSEKINKLSGPSGMGLLVPDIKSDYFHAYLNAPVFILFSDVHFSAANLCTVDVPNKHHIYKIEFLQMLSNILIENEVIDFYTEGTDFTDRVIPLIEQDKNEPMLVLFNLVIQCNRFKRENTPEYNSIKKIQWHHGDIRFWTPDISPQYEDVKTDISKKKCKFYNMKEFLLEKIEMNSYYGYYHKSDAIFQYLFLAYANEIKSRDFILDKYIAVDPEEIYIRLIESKFSLINYQISKIQDKSSQTFLKEKFKLYITYIYNQNFTDAKKSITDLTPKIFNKEIRTIHSHIVWLFNISQTTTMVEDQQKYSIKIHTSPYYPIYKKFIFLFECIKLDMFTFAKSFTRMVESKGIDPIINICYYGRIHINNMIYFLTNILSYQQIFYRDGLEGQQQYDEINTHNVNRCLDLSNINKVSLAQILNIIRQKKINLS